MADGCAPLWRIVGARRRPPTLWEVGWSLESLELLE